MADFPRPELDRRLVALSRDLEQFPPGAPCPWPLARVFNELTRQAKRHLTDDPIVRGVRLIEEPKSGDDDSSEALVGTVRALITQVRVAMDAPAQSD